jgi:hypothetical protein
MNCRRRCSFPVPAAPLWQGVVHSPRLHHLLLRGRFRTTTSIPRYLTLKTIAGTVPLQVAPSRVFLFLNGVSACFRFTVLLVRGKVRLVQLLYEGVPLPQLRLPRLHESVEVIRTPLQACNNILVRIFRFNFCLFPYLPATRLLRKRGQLPLRCLYYLRMIRLLPKLRALHNTGMLS